ncbi:MAG TPA: class I SAM-dependent rRNA methyltransferase [Vicinamibacterales bacterium]|jgi:23S rRNA (cytosine1962-C5)-methyltransferase|nr:class I SAM-dependent rRNA methyltransferase [Vicinamibacterales bacterium]
MTSFVVVGTRGERRIATGHPWIYRADLGEVRANAGDLVVVKNHRGRILGHALYSDRSQIALRLLTFGEQPAGPELIATRIGAAIAFRESALGLAPGAHGVAEGSPALKSTAYRLVHGEGDLLPSLIVDRYGDYLVVQTLSQAMDRLTPVIVEALSARLSPKGILARNDPRTRLLEGLDQRVEVLAGDIPEAVDVVESGVQYSVDVRRGQKTGLFLDQRENREAAAQYAHGRLLDCFSYNGGFALTLAPRCTETIAFDVSEDAVERIRANASRNGRAVDARAGNVFDELRGLERTRARFDTIVLDPPAFAKSKTAVEKATSGYKEINLRALKLLNPGGVLVTCSCSYHVNEAAFAEIVYEAAVDAQVQVNVVEKRMQGRDHPVLLGVPETYYLKCFILRKLA